MATTKVTTNVIDMKDNTGGLTWVKGTTAQRTTTTIGDLRENTETYRAEIYTDQTGTAAWRNLKESAIDNSFTVNFLVVAGGGGGGGSHVGYTAGGGGGAGGLRTSFGSSTGGGVTPAENSVSLEPSTAYTVTVGAGGTAGGGGLTTGPNGGNGVNSEFSGSTPSFSIISDGGGGGGSAYNGSAALTAGGSGVDQQVIITHQVRPLQVKVLRVEQLLEIKMEMVLVVAAVQLMLGVMVEILLVAAVALV